MRELMVRSKNVECRGIGVKLKSPEYDERWSIGSMIEEQYERT